MGVFINRLLRRLDRCTQWPLEQDRAVWRDIDLWIALRESDREHLSDYVGWDEDGTGRRYKIDPLAPKINEAFASLQYGRIPEIVAADEGDQDRLDELLEDNVMGASLQAMAHLKSSEGQAWWRILVDHEAADHPMLEWHSRQAVTVLWVGKKVKAVAFINRLDPIEEESGNANKAIAWRHLELHDEQHVLNVLYRGTDRTLGERVSLEQHPEVEHLRDVEFSHGMGEILAGRVVNRYGVNFREGISDFDGIEDFLLDLNESCAIAHENTRLAGKKRVVAPESALDEAGRLPAHSEVLVAEAVADSAALGEEGKQLGAAAAFKVIEYSYDAAPMIAYQDSLAVKALTRVGITPQFVGMPVDGEGSAETGVALRLRLIPSVSAGNDRAQDADAVLPHVLELMQRLDAAPAQQDGAGQIGGFGRPWTKAEEAPSVDRGTALPEDRTEETERHSIAVSSEIESRETAIEEMHPDWSEERVKEELKRITSEHKLFSTAGLGSLLRDMSPNGNGTGGGAGNGAQPPGPPPEGDETTPPAVGAGAAAGAAT